MTPKQIIKIALQNNIPSISYTYVEPTIFSEFTIDTMKLAQKQGIKNIWISNDYMNPQSTQMVIPYLDANNIDIKGFTNKFYIKNCNGSLKPVLETAQIMKKTNIWLEIDISFHLFSTKSVSSFFRPL